jgi:riboflavin synthase
VFTGIVEAVARVRGVTPRGAGSLLSVAAPESFRPVATGESISVSGVCLTVLPPVSGQEDLVFDVSPETLRRSTMGAVRPGARVNLERALAVGGRFGGHMVAGHVDARTRVCRVERAGEFWTYTFDLEDGFARYVVEKGSIALDGVSLTVASLSAASFDVAVIPHTFETTTLGERAAGDEVNVEVDLLGKYVERLLGSFTARSQGERDERFRGLLSA